MTQSRRPGSRLLLAGLGLTLALALAPSTGRAGIIVDPVGDLLPIGDPTWEYDFKVYVSAGDEVTLNNFLTITDLHVGSGPSVPTDVEPPAFWFPSHTPIDGSGNTTVTWTWISPTQVIDNTAGTSPLFVGDFFVVTNFDASSPPPPGTLITFDWTSSTTSDPNLTGTVTVQTVPEPVTVLGLLSASPLLMLGYHRSRRRRTLAV